MNHQRNNDRLNLELRSVLQASIFRNCRDRANKGGNYTAVGSNVPSQDELDQFSNCYAMHVESVNILNSGLD